MSLELGATNSIQTDRRQLLTVLSDNEKCAIDRLLQHYPKASGANIDALKIVQQYRGWVSDPAIAALAHYMQVPLAELDSVATFYNLIFRRPVGPVIIHPCNGISCQLLGYKNIQRQLASQLQLIDGGTTTDGQLTLLSLPCLGACDKAPVVLVRISQPAESVGDAMLSSEQLLENQSCSKIEIMLSELRKTTL